MYAIEIALQDHLCGELKAKSKTIEEADDRYSLCSSSFSLNPSSLSIWRCVFGESSVLYGKQTQDVFINNSRVTCYG
jgi:hypothetical protein